MSGISQPIQSGCDKSWYFLLSRCFLDAQSRSIRKLHCFSTLNAEHFYRASGFDTVREIDVPMGPDLTFPGILMGRELPEYRPPTYHVY